MTAASLPFAPLAILALLLGTGLVLLLLSLARSPARPDRPARHHLAAIGAAGSLAALLAALAGLSQGSAPANSLLQADGLGLSLAALIALGSALTLPLVATSRGPAQQAALLLFAAAGSALTVLAGDLLVMVLGLEIAALAMSAATICGRNTALASEAALKRFLATAAAGVLALYGVAHLYGVAGVTSLPDLRAFLEHSAQIPAAFWVGLALLLIGLALQAALVPLHFWAPDLAQAAPVVVVAFEVAAVRVGVVGALLRLATQLLGPAALVLPPLEALIVLTMVGSALLALRQHELRRFLAHALGAQLGIAAVGVLAATVQPAGGALPATLSSLLAVVLLGAGAFGLVQLIEDSGSGGGGIRLSDLRGLGLDHPLAAACLALFLLALAGFPPTLLFIARLQVLTVALSADQLAVLVAVGLTQLLLAVAALRIALTLFQGPAGTACATPHAEAGWLVTVLCALALTTLGLVPEPLVRLAHLALGG